jgi:hypothetical protein
VVEMDWKQRTFWQLKMRHDFELYFWVAAGERSLKVSVAPSRLGIRGICSSPVRQSISDPIRIRDGIGCRAGQRGLPCKNQCFGWI